MAFIRSVPSVATWTKTATSLSVRRVLKGGGPGIRGEMGADIISVPAPYKRCVALVGRRSPARRLGEGATAKEFTEVRILGGSGGIRRKSGPCVDLCVE